MRIRVPAQYQSEFVIWSALSLMRHGPFLIRVSLPQMRNKQFLVRSGLSPMRNSPFLIWVGLPLIRNGQLLIRSRLSLTRDRLFLIRVCLPLMWKSRLLIGFGFSAIRESQLSSGPGKGYRDGFGRPDRLFIAKKATRSATFYKYLSRTMNLSALSRFYRNSGIFCSAQVAGWTPPVVVPRSVSSFRRDHVAERNESPRSSRGLSNHGLRECDCCPGCVTTID